jgi:hypothetical protein
MMEELKSVIVHLEELFTYIPSHESEDMMCWGEIKDGQDKSMQYVEASEVKEVLDMLKKIHEDNDKSFGDLFG